MQLFQELKEQTELRIAALGFESKQPASLYAPMAYLLALPGKRIRPLLTMLAYQAVGGKAPHEAINLGIALELFHNFTLMHDDIMDAAPLRRGRPTVHMRWDTNTAILSGDAMFAISMGMISEAFPAQAARLNAEFVRVAVAVCEGQMEDMDLAAMEQVNIPLYLEMIRKKTAVLLGGCLSLAAMAAGASDELADDLRRFGERLGVAFQLQDDLMDAFPPEGFGKQTGGDIIENKKTFLLLSAIEQADKAQQQALSALLRNADPEEKVNGVLAIYKSLNIDQQTISLINRYFDEARDMALQLSGNVNMDLLRQYMSVIASRNV